jgi:hypothetical protein
MIVRNASFTNSLPKAASPPQLAKSKEGRRSVLSSIARAANATPRVGVGKKANGELPMPLNPYETSTKTDDLRPRTQASRAHWFLFALSAVLGVVGVSILLANFSANRGMPRRYAKYVAEYDFQWTILSPTTFAFVAIGLSAILMLLSLVRLREHIRNRSS